MSEIDFCVGDKVVTGLLYSKAASDKIGVVRKVLLPHHILLVDVYSSRGFRPLSIYVSTDYVRHAFSKSIAQTVTDKRRKTADSSV